MITDAWKYHGKTPSPSSLETRKRDSFSRLDEFHTIVVIVPFAKIKKKRIKLPPAIFLPVMQYSWAGTRGLGEKLSSDRISDQVKSVGERYRCWTCVRSKEFQRVIGANHGGDDFCFRCMRTTIDFHRCGARTNG